MPASGSALTRVSHPPYENLSNGGFNPGAKKREKDGSTNINHRRLLAGPAMTRFWLIRHGSHAWLGKALVGRQPGILLNWYGRQEAEGVADPLGSRPFA